MQNNQLKSIVERIESLEAQKAEIADDIKDIYAEAKGNGYDVKILRKVIDLRKKDQAQVDHEQALIDLYVSALGGLDRSLSIQAYSMVE